MKICFGFDQLLTQPANICTFSEIPLNTEQKSGLNQMHTFRRQFMVDPGIELYKGIMIDDK